MNNRDIERTKLRITRLENLIAFLNDEKEFLDERIKSNKFHLDRERERLSALEPVCEHSYSKAMNQPYPRPCVKCGEPEELQGEALLQLQSTCNHLYSRSIDQPYPRLCEICKQLEAK